MFPGFRPAALAFLRGLARNNRREWFEARRASYETEVREPMRALVEEMDVQLARLAPDASPKRVQDEMDAALEEAYRRAIGMDPTPPQAMGDGRFQ